mmetsp:Transcript_39996/g.120954  ORF Transcript_39996/g.120954 Transcript_39996/m.120954 type:complete len:371 (+) Transcript_39996:29-1141(+)
MSGMDRDWGVKSGGGGVASDIQAKVDRRERLRQLALQTVDLMKDPYFMKNHLGSYECKLCLTLHNNEGNYLAHTQGKRHQQNLARRAAKEALNNPTLPQANSRTVKARKTVKIGRPGYRVTKQLDPETQQRSLLFEVDYPEIEESLQPRHRFMSAFEQRVEPPDKEWQYLLVAAEPYETVAFKIPNTEIDKAHGKFHSAWNDETKTFTVQLYFKAGGEGPHGRPLMRPPPPPPPPPPPGSSTAMPQTSSSKRGEPSAAGGRSMAEKGEPAPGGRWASKRACTFPPSESRPALPSGHASPVYASPLHASPCESVSSSSLQSDSCRKPTTGRSHSIGSTSIGSRWRSIEAGTARSGAVPPSPPPPPLSEQQK